MIPLRYRIEFAILNAIGAVAWGAIRLAIRGFGLASCPSTRGLRSQTGPATYSA